MRNIKNIITAKVIVEHTSNTHRDHFAFTDKWNFIIDKFTFARKSDNELEVTFLFEAVLTRVDDERHITHQELPSEHTRRFQIEEERLETLLDLISLSSGNGLRIKPDSYSFSSATSRDEPIVNNLTIDPSNINTSEKQYQRLIKYRNKKIGLISALRAYRLGLWSERPGYRIPQLYSALEQAYGKGSGGSLLTKEERKKIARCLTLLGINNEKKSKVMHKLSQIPAKTINEVLTEKVGLMNEKGKVDNKEKKRLFVLWARARSIAAHGNILPPRGPGIQTLLYELQSTTEALLYKEVKPKLIHYFVFKKNTLKPQFIKNKGELISDLGEYSCFAARNDMITVYLQNIGHEIIVEGEFVYLVSPSGTRTIDQNGNVNTISESALNDSLKKIVSQIAKKIHR